VAVQLASHARKIIDEQQREQQIGHQRDPVRQRSPRRDRGRPSR